MRHSNRQFYCNTHAISSFQEHEHEHEHEHKLEQTEQMSVSGD